MTPAITPRSAATTTATASCDPDAPSLRGRVGSFHGAGPAVVGAPATGPAGEPTATRPLRFGTVAAFLEWGPDNTYAAYVAGLLAPIAAALLLTGALALPPAYAVLTVLHLRLTPRDRVTAAAPPS
ncbi:hypothetical protein ABZ424_05440 [Streptomyces sp. NPDC005790]|uniref:hypothetical protein n=1 Tax=Streptomyces sp. NPDC005790 TaxID=3154777 RepID=UPI0033DA01C4